MSRLTLVAVLLVLGCYRNTVSPAEGQASFSARWINHAEDDVLVQYGNPDDVVQLSSGNRVLSYHREMAVSSSRGFAYAGGGGSRSDSSTVFCDRRFEIDKDSKTVARAVITGSDCDYSR
jgi:hypothetical protein